MQEAIKNRCKKVGAKTINMKRQSVMALAFLLSVGATAVLTLLVFGIFANVASATTDLNKARMSIMPSSGKAPLTVKTTLYAESQLLCTAFEIDWGDGSPEEYYDPGVYDSNCYGGKFKREFSHTYATSSLYTVLAKVGADSLENLNAMSLSVTAYDEDWAGDLTETQQESCFINPNTGFVPFVAAAYVPLGGALCDGTYEYYINWGDGYRSESRYCDKTANYYDTFYYEYATSSNYTAEFVQVNGTSTIPTETCEVSVSNVPELTITKPDWGGTAVIGKPFVIEWELKDPPPARNGIDPTVRLTFVTYEGSAGFIADLAIDEASYEWTPTSEPCLEGVCQSSIGEGKYYLQASVIYDTCSGDPYCGESIPVVATYKTAEPITVSATGEPTDSWLYTVRDRMFASPTVVSAPAIVYFTTVLNSEASCAGGVYTIEYGDGESSSMAFPQGKCAAFASSFTHTYSASGVYSATLRKNGIESARINITITNPITARSSSTNLASAWTAFLNLITRWFAF